MHRVVIAHLCWRIPLVVFTLCHRGIVIASFQCRGRFISTAILTFVTSFTDVCLTLFQRWTHLITSVCRASITRCTRSITVVDALLFAFVITVVAQVPALVAAAEEPDGLAAALALELLLVVGRGEDEQVHDDGAADEKAPEDQYPQDSVVNDAARVTTGRDWKQKMIARTSDFVKTIYSK